MYGYDAFRPGTTAGGATSVFDKPDTRIGISANVEIGVGVDLNLTQANLALQQTMQSFDKLLATMQANIYSLLRDKLLPMDGGLPSVSVDRKGSGQEQPQ